MNTCPRCFAGVGWYRSGYVWRWQTHSIAHIAGVQLCGLSNEIAAIREEVSW